MSAATRDGRDGAGVEFIYEDDLVTARDTETGIASSGESRSEALAMLAEALALHEGEGEPVEDEAAFFEEIGVDFDDIDVDESPPPWLE